MTAIYTIPRSISDHVGFRSVPATAEPALRETADQVITAHKLSDEPIAVGRDGKAARVLPKQLVVREESSKKHGIGSHCDG
jgi:hypothetical protein